MLGTSLLSALALTLVPAPRSAGPATSTSGDPAAALHAQGPHDPQVPQVAPSHPLESSVTEFTLANGWRFFLVPRPGAPVVAIETAIGVGSVQDGPGHRGLANLFAHLTLQGSERVGSVDWAAERVALAAVEEAHHRWLATLETGDADETAKAYGTYLEARDRARELASPESFRRFLEDAGAAPTMQVETAPDWTRFAVTLPSNQLELWCWLEAERFTRPCLRGFFGERDRQVEARQRDLESAPLTTLLDQLRLAALATHPYRHPVTGYVEDLSRLEKAAAEDFFRDHYGASRLVTTIVGDFRPETLRPLLERYLAAVPANPDSTARGDTAAPEPVPSLQRRIVVPYPSPTRMAFGWATPPFAHTDSAAVEVSAHVLEARLRERLRADALAIDLEVRAGWPGSRSENLLVVTLTPMLDVDAATVEEAVAGELSRLRESGPTADEVGAATGRMRLAHELALADPPRLARLLNEHHLLAGEWRSALRRPDEWGAVSPGAVQAVVDVYLTDARRTLAVLEPDGNAPPVDAAAAARAGSSPAPSSGRGADAAGAAGTGGDGNR